MRTTLRAEAQWALREILGDQGCEMAEFTGLPMSLIVGAGEDAGELAMLREVEQRELAETGRRGLPVLLARGQNGWTITLRLDDLPSLIAVVQAGWDGVVGLRME